MPRLAEMEVTSPDPAAGAAIVFTAPEDCVVNSLAFSFATSAVAATRQVEARGDDGSGNIFFRSISQQTQLASTTQYYYAFAGLQTGAPGSNRGPIALPANGLKMRKGDKLTITAINLDPGDDFSAAFVQYDRI